MLLRNLFFSSIIMRRVLAGFMHSGKKQTVELTFLKLFLDFSYSGRLPLVYHIYYYIELLKPSIGVKRIFRGRQISWAVTTWTAQQCYSNAVKWFRAGVMGQETHRKLKQQKRLLRRRLKDLAGQAKSKKFVLTDQEQALLSTGLNKFSYGRPEQTSLLVRLQQFFISCSVNPQQTFGWRLLELHIKKILEIIPEKKHYRWKTK